MRNTTTLAALALGACVGPWPGDAGSDVIVVADAVQQDTVWTADTTYVLDDVIFVDAGATLTIEPGTTVQGREGSALVVTRTGFLDARGREGAPIVFTSDLPTGERFRGAWGGLALLGNAPVNADEVLEGLDEDDPRGSYGGNDPTDGCGLLE
jgi:hypothetical protein